MSLTQEPFPAAIYADNSATTGVSEKALLAMTPYFRETFGNPSSIHRAGQDAKKALEQARRTVSSAIGALNNEIYFTSGGTESDNWAIQGVCGLKRTKGAHIVSTAVEHNAVLRTLKALQTQGYEVTLLEPDKYGQIRAEQVAGAIRSDTVLVSIMTANNVVGTILPIPELCAVAHAKGVLFHTDAVQAVGHIPVRAHEWGVDLLSMSAHKFHGPKGVGALFIKVPLNLPPYLNGGGQEKERRSGTENVAGIVGMAAALEEMTAGLSAETPRISALRDTLIDRVLAIPGAALTGDPVNRLPGLASFVFEGIPNAVYLINKLNDAGIYASSGSACSASSVEAPHVLTAMGYSEKTARTALRISLSVDNTEQEIEYIAALLPKLVGELRLR